MSEERPAYGREIILRIEDRDFNETALIGKSANFIFNPQTRNGEELSDFLSGCEDYALEKWRSIAKELAEALENISEPLRYMKSQLKEGETLNGYWAIKLMESPQFYKDIADAALQTYKTLNNGNPN